MKSILIWFLAWCFIIGPTFSFVTFMVVCRLAKHYKQLYGPKHLQDVPSPIYWTIVVLTFISFVACGPVIWSWMFFKSRVRQVIKTQEA